MSMKKIMRFMAVGFAKEIPLGPLQRDVRRPSSLRPALEVLALAQDLDLEPHGESGLVGEEAGDGRE